jgi:hypothetical protein
LSANQPLGHTGVHFAELAGIAMLAGGEPTDGTSVIAFVRHSVAGWLGASGGRPLSDADAAMVAEWIARLGMSLVLAPEGAIPLYDDDGLRAFAARYLVPGIVWLAAQSGASASGGQRAVGRSP